MHNQCVVAVGRQSVRAMPNPHVQQRLQAIQAILTAAHKGGHDLSSATIGSERESFVNLVLGNVIAPPFRVGTGDITDHAGRSSGQVDVVIEYSNSISFPLLQGNAARLYLAESVCCVIEVKSDLSKQWKQVVPKAQKLSSLTREPGALIAAGSPPSETIPLFVVGFTGWKDSETATRNLATGRAGAKSLSGVLVIDEGIYVSAEGDQPRAVTGPESIFEFLLNLEALTSSMIAAKPRLRPYIAL